MRPVNAQRNRSSSRSTSREQNSNTVNYIERTVIFATFIGVLTLACLCACTGSSTFDTTAKFVQRRFTRLAARRLRMCVLQCLNFSVYKVFLPIPNLCFSFTQVLLSPDDDHELGFFNCFLGFVKFDQF